MKKSRTLWWLLLVVVFALMSGGCGSDSNNDSGRTTRHKLYVLGEMHGDLADELAEKVNCVPYSGVETDAPLLISHSSGFSVDAETSVLMRLLLESGQAVAVEHASESEINQMLEGLGLESDFQIPTGFTYVEFYGLKLLDDEDVLVYVVLNDDERVPDEIHEMPDKVMIGEDQFVASDDLDLAITQEFIDDLSSYGLSVSGDEILSGDQVLTSEQVTSGDWVLTADGLWMPGYNEVESPAYDDDLWEEFEGDLADNIIEWLYSTEQQAEYTRNAKASALNDFSRTANDLASISRMYQKTYDASIYGQTFKIIVDVYACHSFNQADGSDADWFFIKQTGQLNPASNYAKEGPTSKKLAHIKGYMVEYAFDNYLVDATGNVVNTNVALQQAKPESTVGSTGIDSSISFSFGGNIGFSGLAAAGGVSAGASFSSSQSQTVPECQVTNQSLQNISGVVQQHAKWLYSFSRPQTTGGKAFGDNNFHDAPAAARSLFQPVNQWAWRIDPAARDHVKNFKFKFRWKNGYSNGESFAFGIRADKVRHVDWVQQETEFNVTFDPVYPPLIAANTLDFSKAAGYEKLTVATCRNWTASSDSSWCQLSRTSGTMADAGDIYVTVDDNTTGRNREAYITLKTTDGKGTFKVKIFQAKN